MDNIKSKTDEEIVKSVRDNNKEMYAELIRRYDGKLIRYAEYLSGDYEKASDAVQESFIKAYINLNSFDLKKKFSSWIYRIVHNEVINIIGKNEKTVQIDSDIDFDSGINMEENYIKKELVLHARECLKQMGILYSEPISLYYLEDKSYEEISDILRIPMGTVAVRINRAKILLRKICQSKIK